MISYWSPREIHKAGLSPSSLLLSVCAAGSPHFPRTRCRSHLFWDQGRSERHPEQVKVPESFPFTSVFLQLLFTEGGIWFYHSLLQSFPLLAPLFQPSAGGSLHMTCSRVLLLKRVFSCHCHLFGWKLISILLLLLLLFPSVHARMLFHCFNIFFSPILFQGNTRRSGSIVFKVCLYQSVKSRAIPTHIILLPYYYCAEPGTQ